MMCTLKSWLTILSIKEDLIIQIFDNQSSVDENVGVCIFISFWTESNSSDGTGSR